MKRIATYLTIFVFPLFAAYSQGTEYDVILRNGTLYDGSGKPGVVGDVALKGDKIAAIGNWENIRGKTEIDAT
ncbi:MAG: D-aminoacylase, partial [Ignavibacteriales bacterium]|nr:D-aminoacylase [Ignavibacteriales bacterium]